MQANLAFTVGKRQQNRIMAGYQYKQAEYKNGGPATDLTYHGPTSGLNFRFWIAGNGTDKLTLVDSEL